MPEMEPEVGCIMPCLLQSYTNLELDKSLFFKIIFYFSQQVFLHLLWDSVLAFDSKILDQFLHSHFLKSLSPNQVFTVLFELVLSSAFD